MTSPAPLTAAEIAELSVDYFHSEIHGTSRRYSEAWPRIAATLAERDARIAELERERDRAIASTEDLGIRHIKLRALVREQFNESGLRCQSISWLERARNALGDQPAEAAGEG